MYQSEAGQAGVPRHAVVPCRRRLQGPGATAWHGWAWDIQPPADGPACFVSSASPIGSHPRVCQAAVLACGHAVFLFLRPVPPSNPVGSHGNRRRPSVASPGPWRVGLHWKTAPMPGCAAMYSVLGELQLPHVGSETGFASFFQSHPSSHYPPRLLPLLTLYTSSHPIPRPGPSLLPTLDEPRIPPGERTCTRGASRTERGESRRPDHARRRHVTASRPSNDGLATSDNAPSPLPPVGLRPPG